jgi:L-malate glycosyltransferase
MRVLWIVNTVFPEPSKALGLSAPVSGGWMYGLAKQVIKSEKVKLTIATIYTGTELKLLSIEGIDYYLLPCKNKIKYDTKLEQYWEQVCAQFLPDLVHIHGTEYAHGLACMRKLPNLRYVISIQGLVSVYSKYFYAGILFQDIIKNITLRNLIKNDSIFNLKRQFEKRGKLEEEYLKTTNHIIGRTNWDYAHTKSIKRIVNYHFCNESLRLSFYSSRKWSIEKHVPQTIFLSQATSPIKGLHQVLKAVILLKPYFPNLSVRIAGSSIVKQETLIDLIKLSGYGKYILSIIKKGNLENNIVFLGNLSEEQMAEEYSKANVFICPSSIENSPNSVGEAQIIGVPLIASYVGGISNMVEDGCTGLLYRFEEVEMLAENIQKIFIDDELAKTLSENGIQVAEKRHNLNSNLKQTIHIYNSIINNVQF